MARVGRPLKFGSLEEMQTLIDAYFANTLEEEWTVTGLALALDTTRDVLIDYQERNEFARAIEKAKEMVHHAYEKDLRRKGRSGDIFALKNFGWSDKQEVDHTTKGERIDNSEAVLELTNRLNEIYRGTSSGSDGESAGAVGVETQDKE